jgi:plasmid maintenance system killer protein
MALQRALENVTNMVTRKSQESITRVATMLITVPDNKLKAALGDAAICRKRYGADMAKKIFQRVGSLTAAESLATFYPPYSGPERCHELIGDLIGVFSMDVKQPYRLLFVPADDIPKTSFKTDLERWKAINSIVIRGIEDTHV